MSHSTGIVKNYYREMREFKSFFINRCMVTKKYEAHKLWAHWLIRILCKNGVNHHLIPNKSAINDKEIVDHLKLLGIDDEQCISQFYSQIIDKLNQLFDSYNDPKLAQLHDKNQMSDFSNSIHVEKQCKNGKNYVMYKLDEIYVKYQTTTHSVLIERYVGDINLRNFYMFEMGYNYYILDGYSLQWCIPPKSLQILEKSLFLKTELFASPINAYLPSYYSLFNVDKMFGAIDNFFVADLSTVDNGVYEVNPPFIEYVFVESSLKIVNMLEISQRKSNSLMFIYVMPGWFDSKGYQILKNSPFMMDEIVLPEKNHFYYHCDKNKLIVANFETHVLLLGTSTSKNLWTPKIKSEFIDNYTHY